MDADLLRYYGARASEYEAVYAKPERQAELSQLHQLVPDWFAKRRVLEVACGTGYWTRRIARTAAQITACDLAPETLNIARSQCAETWRVQFVEGDAFALATVSGTFDAAFVGFFYSHISRVGLHAFLAGLHQRVSDGARVMILDNRYVEGSNWPITRTDAIGNTYQDRLLANGTEYEVMKNFPSDAEVEDVLTRAGARHVHVHTLPHFWYATYDVGGAT